MRILAYISVLGFAWLMPILMWAGSSDKISIPNVPIRLIKLSPTEYKLASESELLELKRKGINFLDITGDSSSLETTISSHQPEKPIAVYNYPTTAKYKNEVTKILKRINIDRMKTKLSKFSSFYTRYYKSEFGVDSANWLYNQVREIAEPVKDKVIVNKFNHKGWDQHSIIVRIPGQAHDKVVLGAHQDSINLKLPMYLPAPGMRKN